MDEVEIGQYMATIMFAALFQGSLFEESAVSAPLPLQSLLGCLPLIMFNSIPFRLTSTSSMEELDPQLLLREAGSIRFFSVFLAFRKSHLLPVGSI